MARKSKKPLVKKLVELGHLESVISDLSITALEEMLVEANDVSPAVEITSNDGSKKIDETDPEWSDYVISQLPIKNARMECLPATVYEESSKS